MAALNIGLMSLNCPETMPTESYIRQVRNADVISLLDR